MKRQLALHLLLVAACVPFGCAREPEVWTPPRIDLHQFGTLGMIEIQSPQGYGSIASRQFMAAIHSAQPGVPVLELGEMARVLGSVGQEAMGPEAVRAIGEKYRVDVVVVGDLEIDSPRPNWSLQSFTEANASADIHGSLSARFCDADSGATIWSNEAGGSRSVANLNMSLSARPQFSAVDPEGEQAKLVSWLVGRVTGDFRGYWARP